MEKQILGTTNRTCLTSASFPGMAREMFSKIKLLDTAIHSKTSSSNKTMKCLLFLKIWSICAQMHPIDSNQLLNPFALFCKMFSPQTSKKTQHECRGPTNGSMYVFCFTRKSWGPPPALRATPASGGYVLCERFAPPPETFPPAGQLTFPLWRGWSDEGGPGEDPPWWKITLVMLSTWSGIVFTYTRT